MFTWCWVLGLQQYQQLCLGSDCYVMLFNLSMYELQYSLCCTCCSRYSNIYSFSDIIMSSVGNDNPSFECEHMTKVDNRGDKCEESVKIDDNIDNNTDSELSFEDKVYQGNIVGNSVERLRSTVFTYISGHKSVVKPIILTRYLPKSVILSPVIFIALQPLSPVQCISHNLSTSRSHQEDLFGLL